MAVDGAVQDIEQQQGQGLKVTLLALPKEVRDYTGLTKRGVQAVALQYPEDKTLDKTLAGPSSKLQQSHFESLNECLRQFEKGGKIPPDGAITIIPYGPDGVTSQNRLLLFAGEGEKDFSPGQWDFLNEAIRTVNEFLTGSRTPAIPQIELPPLS